MSINREIDWTSVVVMVMAIPDGKGLVLCFDLKIAIFRMVSWAMFRPS